jgi:hypothetical protein
LARLRRYDQRLAFIARLAFVAIGLTSSPCGAQEVRKLFLVPELVQGVYIYANHPLRGVTSAQTARLSAWLYDH